MSKRIPRFYVEIPLSETQITDLPAEIAHHLHTVLRKKISDQLILFNGDGKEYLAIIETIEKKQLSVFIQSVQHVSVESPIKITLAQGLSKGQKMDFTLQKSVELGVHRIVPIINERSSIKVKSDKVENKLSHWRKVIISAAEQCGRTMVPQLLAPMDLDDWLKNDTADLKILLAPTSSMSITQLPAPNETVSLLIGSEGGFSEDEIRTAVAKGYESVKLGPRILRTETAALVVLSVLQSVWGDFA